MTLDQKRLLTVLLAAEHQETLRITDEQAQRRSPSVAQRALLAHELTAQVRFADIEDDLDTAVDEATALLEDLHTEVKSLILVEIFGEDREPRSPAEAHEVIHRLTTDQPDQVQESEARVGLAIAGILAGLYLAGGRRVIEEAERQGVPTSALSPAALPVEAFQEQAATVAQHPWRRITRKIEDDLSDQATLARPQITPDEVERVLDDIRIDGSRDQARQATQTTAGQGRIDTVEQTPELEPDQIWSSEIMDGNQCPACEEVDGRDFASLAEARQLYPNGPHINCHGGARCRGTLIFLFGSS
ncbi:hypothetical protein [Nesterenkonia sp. HG001]|uniref:hypothetical protein n=1 Tax=Nesterenkonia sp. HG001 TaxID=2983207 RepID=UPI002AC494F2|nr:hypothetical protein [Nesterenkonia sp. HG001]MDZ5076745.1 phage head morphogenesis protein [Nesterenkonia sp. HG001]